MTCRPWRDTAESIKAVMAGVPGIADLAVFNSLGQPTVEIDIDRARAARYGLAPGDINAVIQAAIGGQAAGNLYETSSDRNFPIMVRLAPEYRHSLDAIRRITSRRRQSARRRRRASAAVGRRRCQLVSGASFIYRENQERYIPIKFWVRGRDLGSAVQDAQQPHRRRSPSAAGLSPGMGGRIRRIPGRDAAPGRDRAASASC